MKFKVGDRVRIIKGPGSNFSGRKIGETFTIAEIHNDPLWTWAREFKGRSTGEETSNLELVESPHTISPNHFLMFGNNIQRWEANYKPFFIDDAVLEDIKPKKTLMTKLNTMMKKLLDADTQTLVKAGYINGDLELTSAGRDALNTIVFQANKAALVAMAQEALEEEKAAN